MSTYSLKDDIRLLSQIFCTTLPLPEHLGTDDSDTRAQINSHAMLMRRFLDPAIGFSHWSNIDVAGEWKHSNVETNFMLEPIASVLYLKGDEVHLTPALFYKFMYTMHCRVAEAVLNE